MCGAVDGGENTLTQLHVRLPPPPHDQALEIIRASLQWPPSQPRTIRGSARRPLTRPVRWGVSPAETTTAPLHSAQVIFSNPREGRAEVIVAPLERLTPVAKASMEQVGTPEGVLLAIGQFLTGNFLESEDIVSAKSVKASALLGDPPGDCHGLSRPFRASRMTPGTRGTRVKL